LLKLFEGDLATGEVALLLLLLTKLLLTARKDGVEVDGEIAKNKMNLL